MEDDDYASSVDDLSDIGDEKYIEFDSAKTSASKPKFQSRSVSLKACWIEEMRMAELVETKGNLWRTTGILRNGKTYLFIEETVFLAQIGALHLLDGNGSCLSKNEIYEKVAQRRNGSCWEHFEAYSHLKYLGYIVKRHGIPWSCKAPKVVNDINCEPKVVNDVNCEPKVVNDVNCESVSIQGMPEENGSADSELGDKNFIIDLFNNMQVGEIRPVFDVYLLNSKFRKSSYCDPSFIICFTSGSPPSRDDIELIQKRCGGTPLKFCHVDHGRVSFFSFDTVQLPVLP